MKCIDISRYLWERPYPGRGILLGRSGDNRYAVLAYFIMGRSVNSRNRVFVPVAEDKGVRTQAHDPGKMADPSLIIYHPVRYVEQTGDTIVTNGDQTDTLRDGILSGLTFAQALKARCFEPDGPNYTPRISGLLHKNGSFALSILKSAEGNPDCNLRFFFGYDNPQPGEGRLIHTYQDNLEPLPAFEGEPRRVSITAPDADSLARELWDSLNPDNRVSLFVRYISLETGECTDRIVNKNVQEVFS